MLSPGTFGDEFSLESSLGVGVLGELWTATNENGDEVVLRVFRPEFHERRFEKQLRNELHAVQRFAHRHLVYVRAVHHIQGRLVQEVEKVQGLSAREVITANELNWVLVLHILEQVALGLADAHDQNLTHGHLSLDKILVRFDGNVVISDLGLQKAFSWMASQADIEDILFGDDAGPHRNYRLAEDDARGFGRLAWEMLSRGRQVPEPLRARDFEALELGLPDALVQLLVSVRSPEPPSSRTFHRALQKLGNGLGFKEPVEPLAGYMTWLMSQDGRKQFEPKLHTTRPTDEGHLITLAKSLPSEPAGSDPFEELTPYGPPADLESTDTGASSQTELTQIGDLEATVAGAPLDYHSTARTAPSYRRPSQVRVAPSDAEKTVATRAKRDSDQTATGPMVASGTRNPVAQRSTVEKDSAPPTERRRWTSPLTRRSTQDLVQQPSKRAQRHTKTQVELEPTWFDYLLPGAAIFLLAAVAVVAAARFL